MLSHDADRYIALRRTLGYKLVKAERHLRVFARFAVGRGETHIRAASVLDWLTAVARTPGARARRLTDLILFARFLQAEDPRHEIPHGDIPRNRARRPIPYIYSPDEIARILDVAGRLRHQKPNPLRRRLYIMLFGLIAATGLRVSEALALRLDDIQPDGVLHIRETKFRKSRLVPLHATVVEALECYIVVRRQRAGGAIGCSRPSSTERCARQP
jgi:site-specific recombinase XerD